MEGGFLGVRRLDEHALLRREQRVPWVDAAPE
jgi:hypothetical protein